MNTGYQKNIVWLLLIGAIAQAGNMWAASAFEFRMTCRDNETMPDFGKRVIETAGKTFGIEGEKGGEKEAEEKRVVATKKALFLNRKQLRAHNYLLALDGAGKEEEIKDVDSKSASSYAMLYNAYGKLKKDDSGREYFQFKLKGDPSKLSTFKKAAKIRRASNNVWKLGNLLVMPGIVLFGMGTYNKMNYSPYTLTFLASGIATWGLSCVVSNISNAIRSKFIKTSAKNGWVEYMDTIFNHRGIESRTKKMFHLNVSSNFAEARYKKLLHIIEGDEEIAKAENDKDMIEIVCQDREAICSHLVRNEGVKVSTYSGCSSSC